MQGCELPAIGAADKSLRDWEYDVPSHAPGADAARGSREVRDPSRPPCRTGENPFSEREIGNSRVSIQLKWRGNHQIQGIFQRTPPCREDVHEKTPPKGGVSLESDFRFILSEQLEDLLCLLVGQRER